MFKCQNKPLKYPSNNIYKYQKNPPKKRFSDGKLGGLFEGRVYYFFSGQKWGVYQGLGLFEGGVYSRFCSIKILSVFHFQGPVSKTRVVLGVLLNCGPNCVSVSVSVGFI